jgi:hypothetical protein
MTSAIDIDLLTMITCVDIWEIVCSYLTGDAVYMLAQVQFFAQSTVQTPAFQLLSGINDDGFLVPWEDADNVVSNKYIPHPRHFLTFARVTDIYEVAQQLLKETLYPKMHPYYGTYHWRGGPARPSTPECQDRGLTHCHILHAKVAPVFNYSLPNPYHHDEGGPAARVFGLGQGFKGPPFWQVLIDEYVEFNDSIVNGDINSDDENF